MDRYSRKIKSLTNSSDFGGYLISQKVICVYEVGYWLSSCWNRCFWNEESRAHKLSFVQPRILIWTRLSWRGLWIRRFKSRIFLANLSYFCSKKIDFGTFWSVLRIFKRYRAHFEAFLMHFSVQKLLKLSPNFRKIRDLKRLLCAAGFANVGVSPNFSLTNLAITLWGIWKSRKPRTDELYI